MNVMQIRKENLLDYDFFVQGYIVAMFFTEEDELESVYFEDLSDDALAQVEKDCKKFQKSAGALILATRKLLENEDSDKNKAKRLDVTRLWEQAGHDFWFTRNGHGVGFWDGDWPKTIGEHLTKLSKEFPPLRLYRGDDNKIHMEHA